MYVNANVVTHVLLLSFWYIFFPEGWYIFFFVNLFLVQIHLV